MVGNEIQANISFGDKRVVKLDNEFSFDLVEEVVVGMYNCFNDYSNIFLQNLWWDTNPECKDLASVFHLANYLDISYLAEGVRQMTQERFKINFH